jgi:enoyl-[acyl-carrier protein] reductase/trans-2-enoyl-CoA reductase (NAD+)
VTQASSAIPVIPLYISLLYKIMKRRYHEGCIEQIQRLYSERLLEKRVAVDDKGRIQYWLGDALMLKK